MALNPLKGRIESIAYTYFSIVYAIKGDEETVLKGEAIWLNGREYDRRPCASEAGDNLWREAHIYKILGHHDHITRCYGLEVFEGTNHAWALRLERAPHGCLRKHVVESPRPTDMKARLGMAVEFARGVAHVHSCGVVWGDLSTRNALLFDGFRVKLCDFAGALLPGVFDEITNEYEVRYCPTGPEENWPAVGTVERELYGLGTAIYEITEWKVPYGTDADEQDVEKALHRGELPQFVGDNPRSRVSETIIMFTPSGILGVVVGLILLAAPASARTWAGPVDMQKACQQQYDAGFTAGLHCNTAPCNGYDWRCYDPDKSNEYTVDVSGYCNRNYNGAYADPQGGGPYDWGCYWS
ncbi:kinase-like protein [Coniochaeta ligniaria NRRL 30616]|uniref:Kinase-like protein n=1 Tax=Coniochaeta ligniaria NRRL 30616 TaxID=1408157 RepID=A0A1J7IJH2_9PEZI|nr:kinase-like protein [Coniochaeta ligniaria NRRL 30616]